METRTETSPQWKTTVIVSTSLQVTHLTGHFLNIYVWLTVKDERINESGLASF